MHIQLQFNRISCTLKSEGGDTCPLIAFTLDHFIENKFVIKIKLYETDLSLPFLMKEEK